MRSYLIAFLSLACLLVMFGCSIKYDMHLYPDNKAYISQTVNLSQRYKVYVTRSQNNSNFSLFLKNRTVEQRREVDKLFHHICEDKQSTNKSWKCNVTGYATYKVSTVLPAHNKYYIVKHLTGSHYQLIIRNLPMFPNKTVMEEYHKTGNNTASQYLLEMNPKNKRSNITMLERYYQMSLFVEVPGTITGVSPSTDHSVLDRGQSYVVFDLNVVRNKFNQSIVINYTETPEGIVTSYLEEYPHLLIVLEVVVAVLLTVGVWFLYVRLKKR